MQDFFNIITGVSAALLILFVLAQSRGAGLGETFGGDSNFYFSRRGPELALFQLTIIMAVIFVLSIVLGILAG